MVHVRLVLHEGELFERELVQFDCGPRLILDYQPLPYDRSTVIDLKVQLGLDSFDFLWAFKGEYQFLAFGIPFLDQGPALAVPLHPGFEFRYCPAGHLEGIVRGFHLVDPFGEHVASLFDSLESAERIVPSVDCQGSFRACCTKHRLSGHLIDDVCGSEVGRNPENPADKAVGQDHVLPVGGLFNLGDKPAPVNQPILRCLLGRVILGGQAYGKGGAKGQNEEEQSFH